MKKGVSTATDAERRCYYHAGCRPVARPSPVSMATGLRTPTDNDVSGACVFVCTRVRVCVQMYFVCPEKRPGTKTCRIRRPRPLPSSFCPLSMRARRGSSPDRAVIVLAPCELVPRPGWNRILCSVFSALTRYRIYRTCTYIVFIGCPAGIHTELYMEDTALCKSRWDTL